MNGPDPVMAPIAEPVNGPPNDPRSLSPVAPVWHTAILLAVLGVFSWLSASSAPGPGEPIPAVSRPAIYVTVIAFQWLLFALAFWGLRLGGVSVRSLVAYRWSGWGGVGRCGALAVFCWVAIFLGIAQGFDLIGLRDPEEVKRVAEMLLPRGPLEFALWTLISLTAGFVEEVVFRGYLQRQLSAWCRNHAAGIALSALLFGAGHLYQGLSSAALIAAIGLCFSLFAYATRSLVPGILAHATEDFIAGVVGHA